MWWCFFPSAPRLGLSSVSVIASKSENPDSLPARPQPSRRALAPHHTPLTGDSRRAPGRGFGYTGNGSTKEDGETGKPHGAWSEAPLRGLTAGSCPPALERTGRREEMVSPELRSWGPACWSSSTERAAIGGDESRGGAQSLLRCCPAPRHEGTPMQPAHSPPAAISPHSKVSRGRPGRQEEILESQGLMDFSP